MLDIDTDALVDADFDVRQRDGLEPGHFGSDGVVPGRKGRRVLAVAVRGEDAGETCALVDDGDLCARDGRAGGIGDRAENGAADRLCRRRCCQTETQCDDAQSSSQRRTCVHLIISPPLYLTERRA